MSIPSTSSSRGFTLLELVLVLTILAAVSLIAVGRMSGMVAEKHDEDSRRMVEALSAAIAGDPVLRDGTVRNEKGEVVVASFASDVGRLPRARTRAWLEHRELDPGGGDDRTLTLGELMVKPRDVPPWDVHRVVNTNAIAVAADRTEEIRPGNFASVTNMPFAYGWRGPYVRPGPGADEIDLCDGWRRAFAVREGELPDPDAAAILPRQRDFPWVASDFTNAFEIAHVRASRESLSPRTASPVSNAFVRTVLVDVKTDWARNNKGFAPASADAHYGARIFAPGAIDEKGRETENRIEGHGSSPALVFTMDDGFTVGRKIVWAWACAGGRTFYSLPKVVELKADADAVDVEVVIEKP